MPFQNVTTPAVSRNFIVAQVKSLQCFILFLTFVPSTNLPCRRFNIYIPLPITCYLIFWLARCQIEGQHFAKWVFVQKPSYTSYVSLLVSQTVSLKNTRSYLLPYCVYSWVTLFHQWISFKSSYTSCVSLLVSQSNRNTFTRECAQFLASVLCALLSNTMFHQEIGFTFRNLETRAGNRAFCS